MCAKVWHLRVPSSKSEEVARFSITGMKHATAGYRRTAPATRSSVDQLGSRAEMSNHRSDTKCNSLKIVTRPRVVWSMARNVTGLTSSQVDILGRIAGQLHPTSYRCINWDEKKLMKSRNWPLTSHYSLKYRKIFHKPRSSQEKTLPSPQNARFLYEKRDQTGQIFRD